MCGPAGQGLGDVLACRCVHTLACINAPSIMFSSRACKQLNAGGLERSPRALLQGARIFGYQQAMACMHGPPGIHACPDACTHACTQARPHTGTSRLSRLLSVSPHQCACACAFGSVSSPMPFIRAGISFFCTAPDKCVHTCRAPLLKPFSGRASHSRAAWACNCCSRTSNPSLVPPDA